MKVSYRELLFDIVKIVKINIAAGIKKQVGVDGARYAYLKPATVASKKRHGSPTPNMRMMDSGDFVDHALQHTIKSNRLAEVYLSNNNHISGDVTYNQIGNYNNDQRSYFFGISEDTSRKIDLAISKRIDQTIEVVFSEL